MRSETRAAHKLSAKLNRDIIIGGTTLDTPSEFLEHLKVRRRPARLRQKTSCLSTWPWLSDASATESALCLCQQELGVGPEHYGPGGRPRQWLVLRVCQG